MARRHGRRHSRRTTSLKIYVIIAATCAVAALLTQYLYDAPDRMKRLAEEKIQSAVHDAVKDEVRRAAAEGGP